MARLSSNNRACIIALIAASGSGKSHFIHDWLQPLPDRLIVWSPKEKTDNYGRYGQVIRHNPMKLSEYVAANRRGQVRAIFVPDYENLSRASMEKQFNFVCGLVFALKRCTFIGEELSMVTRAGSAPQRWLNCITNGRSEGLSIIGTSQRPALIEKTILSNATQIRCGTLGTAGDKASMADALDVPVSDLRALRRGEFICKDSYSGKLTREGRALDDLPTKARAS